MQHSTSVPTPSTVAGIDWATDTNELCIIDADGDVVERVNRRADAAGICRLVQACQRHGTNRVAIERPDGPVVDALLAGNVEVVVITPRQVKHLRARYGAAGNKDDRFDAFVLADTLRTDPGLLRALQPDRPETKALRAAVRARGDLVDTRIALCNQLRAHLKIVFPGAVTLFAALDSPISLTFLTRFPTADKAAWLSTKRLAAWLKANRYPGRTPAATLQTRLDQAPTGLTGPAGNIAGRTTTAYVTTLIAVVNQIRQLDCDITEQLVLHPDALIFTSLPRSGTIRAAKLLAEIGDARGRFPTEASLAALAGACPSTRQSGRHHIVTFRWACNKKLRDAVMDFAQDSRHASPWAKTIYDRHRATGKTHQHAVRILARAWLRIIWRCWQDHTPYDPTLHGNAKAHLTTAA